MKRYILTLFIYFIPALIWAQTITISKDLTTIDGKTFYLHKAEKGQTLYSISKAYETDINDINAANPELKDGLKAGQTIKIPVKQAYIMHTVVKKETLYGISKKYNIRMDLLVNANPEATNGLKTGQVLKIPVQPSSNNNNTTAINIVNTTNNAIITPPDTVHKLNISKADSLKKDSIDFCANPVKKDIYKVALLIPLYLEDVWTINTSGKKEEHQKPFTFIPFYEGFMLALDSLKQIGLNAEIQVFDIQQDTTPLITLIKKNTFDNMDLIIGPFYPQPLKVMAQFAKGKDISVISPLYNDDEILEKNPNLIQVVPSRKMQFHQLRNFIKKYYSSDTLILAYSHKEKDDLLPLTIQCLKDSIASIEIPYKEITYGANLAQMLRDAMDSTKHNLILGIYESEPIVTDFLTKLNQLRINHMMTVFGLPIWRNFENLDIEYMLNINLHLFLTYHIDYKREDVKNFVRKYRQTYKTEPDRYAFIGYDIATYFLKALHIYGKTCMHCLNKMEYHSLSTDFKFSQPTPDKGLENNAVNIIKFQNFEMINADTLQNK